MNDLPVNVFAQAFQHLDIPDLTIGPDGKLNKHAALHVSLALELAVYPLGERPGIAPVETGHLLEQLHFGVRSGRGFFRLRSEFRHGFPSGNLLLFNIFSMLPSWETDKRINSRIGLQNEGKIYIFNMAFVSEEVYTAIHDAKKDNNEAATFDLSGRRVEHAQRGVYIQDGRKVVVK